MTRSILVPSPLSDEWPDKAIRQQRGMHLAYMRLPGSFERVIPPPKLYGFLVSSAVPLHQEAESMGWLNGALPSARSCQTS